jgi:hypothetical protein
VELLAQRRLQLVALVAAQHLEHWRLQAVAVTVEAILLQLVTAQVAAGLAR